MRLRAAFALLFGGLVSIGSIGACSDKVQPTGSRLVTDVPPPAPPAPDDAQPPSYEASVPDGSDDGSPYTRADADLSACDGCECAKDTSYCFAGATLRAPIVRGGGAGTDGGGDGGGDAGPTTCPTSSGATAKLGCTTLPAECAAKPTCACIIDTLQPFYRCYLNCADDGAKWLVYCPSP